MANRLTRKTGLYLIGNVASRFLGAALIPIYAFSVTPAALGRYDYLLTVGTLVAPIAFVAIWEAALRFLIIDQTEAEAQSRIATIVTFSAFVASFGIGLSLVIGWFLDVDWLDLVGIVTVALLYGCVQVWQFIARAEHQTRLFVDSGIAAGIVTFFLVIVLVVILHLEFIGLLFSYVVGQFVLVVYIELKLRLLRRVTIRAFDWQLLGKMLKYALPLVLNLVSLGILGSIGRILIYNVLGDYANGIYSFAMKFATIIVSLGTVMSMSVIEEGILREGTRQVGEFYTKVLNSLLSLLLFSVMAMVPWLYVFFALVDHTDYFGARDLTPIMLLSAVFSVLATNFGSIFMTVGQTTPIGVATLVGALVSVAGSILAIRPLELFGVACAITVGAFVSMLMRFALSRKYIDYSISIIRAACLIILYLAVFLACYLVAESSWHWGILVLAVVIPGICAWPIVRSMRTIREIPDEIS